jgi:uncharacterized repeat protein (TIGR01451 family)
MLGRSSIDLGDLQNDSRESTPKKGSAARYANKTRNEGKGKPMRSPNQITQRNKSRGGPSIVAGVAVALLIAFAADTANAQTFVNTPTTTTLWGGTRDYTLFGLQTVTAPSSGVVLTGTKISALTGKPIRFLWYGDISNGLCRMDPELDAIIPEVNGIGGHQNNILTCIGAIQKVGFTPGQIAYDPTTQTLYTGTQSRVAAGIIRLHFIPSGDGGNGSLNPIDVQSLIGTQATRNAVGGCPQVKDPAKGTLVPIVPSSAAVGPDGNLYTGSIRDGSIIRIINPSVFNPATDCPNGGVGNVVPLPTDKIQIPILSADERVGSGHTFGLGFIGTTLLGADNIAPWVLFNATQCFTPINGNKICGSPPMGGQAPAPTEILGAFVPAPQAAAATDAQFPTFTGNTAYFAAFPDLTKVTNIASVASMTVQVNYGGAFTFITGLTGDPATLNNPDLYVGVDTSQGGVNGAGGFFKVAATPCAPAPPLAPSGVTASVGTAASGTANVSWITTVNCEPITSYTVRTLLSTGAASGVADLSVPAPASSALVSGLTPGTSYVFEVAACNASGCSAFSAVSNVITAVALGAPPAPTGVTATDAGTGSTANVAWQQLGNGNSPITSSTISAHNAAGTVVATAAVAGSATGGVVSGLTCGASYTFTVTATNAFGTSAASAPSLATPIACQTLADVSLTMSSPATINPGSILTFTMVVTNGGPAATTNTTITGDTLPAPLVSSTTTAGICSGTVNLTAFSCNLGPMAAGATATVTVSVLLPAGQTSGSFTNTATVNALNAAGANMDPNLLNNTASSTTSIGIVGCPLGATTTDLQIGGSAQNGGPALGSGDTFTWQIKDNLGTVPANCVVFTSTLPSNFTLFQVTPSQGTCITTGNAINCALGTINGGGQALVTVNFGVGTLAGTFSTTGTVTFNGTDTNTANNQFTVTIQPH